MLVSPAVIFRGAVLLLMAAYVFCMYGLARAEADVVGLRAGTVVPAALFALVMMVPLVWVMFMLELPELWRLVRAQRRWRGRRCPECGYDVHEALERGACPECAAALVAPREHRFGPATVGRFVVVAGVAWLLGSVACEIAALDDEQRFTREAIALAEAGPGYAHWRERRWPCDSAYLFYARGRGVWAGRDPGTQLDPQLIVPPGPASSPPPPP